VKNDEKRAKKRRNFGLRALGALDLLVFTTHTETVKENKT